MSLLIKILYIFFAATIMALLEIQIEGSNGWAGKLPTWRMQNKLTNFLLGNRELTGYFLLWMLLLLLLFHLPMLFLPWNWHREFLILGLFVLFCLAEDFMWFVLNPAYRLRNFKQENIPWHPSWLGPLPTFYYIEIAIVISLFILSI